MLSVRNISKSFGQTQALKAVSLDASPGEVLAIVGENGSGKSTLMKILSGDLIADTGSINLGEGSATCSLVHQELALCAHMTVAENMFLGVTGNGLARPGHWERQAKEILVGMGYSELDPGARVGALPISLRQIVEIARSEARKSQVVLFDEPSSSLTQSDVAHLFTLIRRLRNQGRTVIYISHFLEEVRAVADRVAVLRDGEVVGMAQMSEISDPEIISLMVGRSVEDLFPKSQRSVGDPLLEITDLSGKQKPLSTSFTLHQGEVVGIAGLNGAGRTEVMRCVMGLDPMLTGGVKIGGVTVQSVSRRWREGVGMVSEDRKSEGLALDLSIAENITMSNRGGWLNNTRDVQSRGETWSKELAVKHSTVDQPVGSLSGGNQQKVAIARLLDSECDVFLLDEPTRGIDVGSKAEIYRLIDRLAVSGKSILVVSSYLPELLGICDRIAVMNRGALSDFVPAESATQESLLEMCVR